MLTDLITLRAFILAPIFTLLLYVNVPFQDQCSLKLEIRDSDFYSPKPTRNFHNESQLFNAGTVGSQASWRFSSVSIPETADDESVALIGSRQNATGLFAVDNVKFTTDERCTPRYGIRISSIN